MSIKKKKNLTKKHGAKKKGFFCITTQGAPLLFLYKVSIVVLIDFIAIFLTPGIFLIQINTNNTNMYWIKTGLCDVSMVV